MNSPKYVGKTENYPCIHQGIKPLYDLERDMTYQCLREFKYQVTLAFKLHCRWRHFDSVLIRHFVMSKKIITIFAFFSHFWAKEQGRLFS